jgi:predicted nucleic acid-binding protein
MTFADVPAGLALFLDANILVYHFTAHPTMGAACTALLERCERQEIAGCVSAHVLGEMAHRLMTTEASTLFGWPSQGIALRMRNHPTEVQQLGRHRQAIDELSLLNVRLLSVEPRQVSGAVDVTRQTGLLFNDALTVVIMRDHGLTCLASNDADFDRVPGLTRYAPL